MLLAGRVPIRGRAIRQDGNLVEGAKEEVVLFCMRCGLRVSPRLRRGDGRNMRRKQSWGGWIFCFPRGDLYFCSVFVVIGTFITSDGL